MQDNLPDYTFACPFDDEMGGFLKFISTTFKVRLGPNPEIQTDPLLVNAALHPVPALARARPLF